MSKKEERDIQILRLYLRGMCIKKDNDVWSVYLGPSSGAGDLPTDMVIFLDSTRLRRPGAMVSVVSPGGSDEQS